MFICGICKKQYDDALVNYHHRVPRSYGGSDDPSNLRVLCPSCHQSLHRVAEHIVNPNKAGLAADLVRSYCSESCADPQSAGPVMMDLAKCAAEYELKVNRGELKTSPWAEKVVSVAVPARFKTAFEVACRKKKCFGRQGSMQSVLESLILNIVAAESPELRMEVMRYVTAKTAKPKPGRKR